MPTSKQNETISVYRALMSEARYRIEAFNFIVNGGTRLADAFVMELCYLQLRMLCETIALACAVVHEDISEIAMNKKLLTEWHAGKIIDQLETLHPHFFPQAVSFDASKKIVEDGNLNAITKQELIDLYRTCGNFLHRGTARNISNYKTTKSKRRLDLPEIGKWFQKIEDLLGTHITVSSGGKMIVLCVLRDSGRNMSTTTIVFEKPQDQ